MGVLYSVVQCCTVSSVQSAVAPRLARAGAGRAVGHFPQSAEVSVQSAQLFALLREQCDRVTELSTSPPFVFVTLSVVHPSDFKYYYPMKNMYMVNQKKCDPC